MAPLNTAYHFSAIIVQDVGDTSPLFSSLIKREHLVSCRLCTLASNKTGSRFAKLFKLLQTHWLYLLNKQLVGLPSPLLRVTREAALTGHQQPPAVQSCRGQSADLLTADHKDTAEWTEMQYSRYSFIKGDRGQVFPFFFGPAFYPSFYLSVYLPLSFLGSVIVNNSLSVWGFFPLEKSASVRLTVVFCKGPVSEISFFFYVLCCLWWAWDTEKGSS